MFFYLSKVLQYLISPIVWILITFLLSIIIKKSRFKRFLFYLSLAMLCFFTNPFIFHEAMRAWEPEAEHKENITKTYDYVIVLSGMITYDDKYERINFKSSADRILQALDLYKDGVVRKIYITGGSGEIFNQKHKESEILRTYLIKLGIPESDILIETNSKNTYENAVESNKFLKPQSNNNTFLLITSAYHMRRAAGCFKKQGFDFDIYVTDRYSGKRKFTFDQLFIPKAEALEGWTLLIHEVSGYIVYDIVGYL